MPKQKFELNELYCLSSSDLLECQVYSNREFIEFFESFSFNKINEISNDKDTTLFVRYIGENLFQEFETGKIILSLDEYYKEGINEINHAIYNHANYSSLRFLFSRFYKYPIMIFQSSIREISDECKKNYINSLEKVEEFVNNFDVLEVNARNLFYSCLLVHADMCYPLAYEEDKIKNLEKRLKSFQSSALPETKESK